jgi:transglutaminase-like putative cysteine protease
LETAMSKTWLSTATALAFAAGALAVFVARKSVLGPEADGPLGWDVKVSVSGTLLTKDAAISITQPPDFRQQHISEERFESSPELRPPLPGKGAGQRKYTWRRQKNHTEPESFHLEYSFLYSRQRPTPEMERRTFQKNQAPERDANLKATPQVPAKNERIVRCAAEQAPANLSPREQAHALFKFVAGLHNLPVPAPQSALECLKQGGGDALGKARLLTALCRNRGLPTRLVAGLVLVGRGDQQLHYWVESWVGNEWLPMDPTHGHFSESNLPENYLILRIGSGPVVAARGVQSQERFEFRPRHNFAIDDYAPSPAKTFWRAVSLYSLHVSEQHMVELLLLLPLAALLVSLARTIIGIQTFGIFAPALIGLAFIESGAFPWGLAVFLVTVLVGWGMRHLLERFHLLQVPRVSALITLIIIFLLAVILGANYLGITPTRYIALFPLVILTFLVERFWTIEAEDSTSASFRTLLYTFVVAVAVSLVLRHDVIRTWMFRYPETLGFVLASLFLLGRYTGYRLTELYRFSDLIQEPPAKTSEGHP